jgi:outer membrane cobalamin receptor
VNPIITRPSTGRWHILLIVFSLLNALSGQAQESLKGKISGLVVDKKTGSPLFGANVMIKGTLLGTSADAEGKFQILNVPIGVFDIESTMIGYKKQVQKGVRILPGMETKVQFQLESTVLLQPTLIVTATKRKQHIEDAPTSVDVLGMAEIQARSVTSLDEVLQNTAGFGVIDGQIDLRGSTGFNWSAGSRVLLMVDGHPLISGDSGGINWDAIPVEEVERVEIVKGAGSALYGSNAMAGMVNIITRDPTPYPETRYKLSWGFYDEPAYPPWRWTDRFLTYQVSELGRFTPFKSLSFGGVDVSHSRQFGKVGLLFTFGRKQSTGYYQNGDFSRWNILGKAKIHLSPGKTLTVTGNWALNDHGDFIQWIGQDRPLEAKSEELGNRVYYEKSNLHATFQHAVNEKLAYTLKTNFYRCHWQNEFRDNRDYSITDRIGTEAQVDYLWRNQSFTFGSEITTHHANSLIYGNRDTWDVAFYGEDEIKFSPLWTFTLGTRFDYHWVRDVPSDQQISPRLGLVYKPREGTSFRFSAGHGFRAPSIAEVFANITVSGLRVVPNLDLKEAERAWSFEIAGRQAVHLNLTDEPPSTPFLSNPLRWAAENFNPSFILDIALFWSQYRNMIDVDINAGLTAVQFINMGRARNRGMEIRIMGNAFKQHVSANIGYTLIDPINLDTGKTLNYRSRHRLNTGLEIKFWKLTVGWDYRYASRIEEIVNVFGSAFDERVPMHVIDGRIILNLNSVQISAEAKNLRNYNYTLRQRFIEPIRHFIFTVRGTL